MTNPSPNVEIKSINSVSLQTRTTQPKFAYNRGDRRGTKANSGFVGCLQWIDLKFQGSYARWWAGGVPPLWWQRVGPPLSLPTHPRTNPSPPRPARRRLGACAAFKPRCPLAWLAAFARLANRHAQQPRSAPATAAPARQPARSAPAPFRSASPTAPRYRSARRHFVAQLYHLLVRPFSVCSDAATASESEGRS
ncbi:hypothetical protein Syun_007328 [Stephania yunnanensis]|uniref:Uncharacterized protein n=1 Tax=Stephania yunnanensis TaxID=152371 RepID=A0AAP0PYF2_9MAGN